MPTFKLKLVCSIEVLARAEITMDAEDIDQAYRELEDHLDKLNKKDVEALSVYLQDKTTSLPKPSIEWRVDREDVDAEIDNRIVEIDEWEEEEE